MAELHPDIESVILSEDDIKQIVGRLGQEVSRDYEGKNPLVVAVLRGAFVFTADLLRQITVPCAVDFMAVSSYGAGVKSSGVVKILKDLDTEIQGRDILIAEDILDSGLTLSYLVDLLRGPRRQVHQDLRVRREGHPRSHGGRHAGLRGRARPQRVHRRAMASTTPSAIATFPTWAS
jgi:hypoxanthine phosphoribosyltransferase